MEQPKRSEVVARRELTDEGRRQMSVSTSGSALIGSLRLMSLQTMATELTPMQVGDIEGQFFVPSYQRGYRWGGHEAERLLQDIYDAKGAPYYLQPIVVKKLDEGRWELIDGQQRLTTLYLVLRYIRENVLTSAEPGFSLEYETRTDSATYLDELDDSRRDENIDFFHIASVYDAISAWFERHGRGQVQAALDLYTALSKSVRVIWYEAAPEVDATELFTRLNIGRIPLTDAELVKALLLAREGGVGERAHQVAAQWDAIERDLRRPDVWGFITGTATAGPTRIELLLDTLAEGPTGRDRPLFHTFETLRQRVVDNRDERGTHAAQMLWDDVVDLHDLIVGWYEDRNLFHKIGYLVASGVPLLELIGIARTESKSDFEDALTARIVASLNLSSSGVGDLSYETPTLRARSKRALLLMNVETIRLMTGSSERYSFDAYAADEWSLEHIHAQSAEKLNRAEQWATWLALHVKALAGMPNVDEAVRAAIEERVAAVGETPTQEEFNALQQEIRPLFATVGGSDDLDVDSIANLALLSSGDNSALSNSVFEVKRREILARDRSGSYIPACTRNVFLKYYSDGEDLQPHFWGPADRIAYLTEMRRVLAPYLTETETPMDDEGDAA